MSKASLVSNRTVRFLMISVIVSAAIIVALSNVTSTLSCPEPPPQPLRQLYVTSAGIVIARVGKSEVLASETSDGEEGESGVSRLKTALLVSRTLKGDHQPVVYVNHSVYADNKDKLSSAASDEDLLVFLERVDGVDGYYVDMNYGLKTLPESDLKIYVSRIEELSSIMSVPNPRDADIVEWLVRCAEEPATRWEGTYDLAMSQYMFDEYESLNPTPVDGPSLPDSSADASVKVEGSDETASVETKRFEPEYSRRTDLAKLLTTEQKYRLTTALVGNTSMGDADYYLLDLVKRWDDPRLVPHLLTLLDIASKPGDVEQNSSYYLQNIMRIVADKLGNDALKALAEKFSSDEYALIESYDEEEQSGAGSQEDSETNTDEASAEIASAIRRRNAELQYFVTLALSTPQETATIQAVEPMVSIEP